ncbi:low-density lipoprotein receptor class A domain-containing protein 2-like [Scleropages formosus]|uniref:Low-density lipoprotein receptor class A domain-containing protein 2-like n=1 Tax=Scleropages formosus TaxID=113540 RepID=A0A0P7UY11_SCLFO|nr:low-density lipoprotein receptor class A domain-containing protein 2-like [Scleropages formosus]
MIKLSQNLQKALPTDVLLSPRNGANKHRAVNLVDTCGQTIQGDRITVKSHQESRKHYFVTMETDCHLTMQAVSPRDNVQFHFRSFLVYSLLRVSPFIEQHFTSSTPLPEASRSLPLPVPTKPGLWSELTTMEGSGDPCYAGSYIQFYDGKNKASPPIGSKLCGKSLPKAVMSTGNYLTLRLVTRGSQPRVDFVGVFTSFRPDSQTNILVLILYITLGLLAGVVVLCWCCWSPGWFLWRVSICHFLSCCSSTCGSCKLCTFSCSCTEFRLSKVTPHGTTNTTVAM